MFEVSETSIKMGFPESEDPSLDHLWRQLDSNFGKCLPFIEETVDRWNQRTKILGNL